MFQCFKPVILGGDHHVSMIDTKHRCCAKYIGPDERLITYVSVREKKGLVFPAIPSSSVASEKHTEDAEKNEELAGEASYEDSEEKIVVGRERHLLRRACRQVFLRFSCQKHINMETKSKFSTKSSNHAEKDPKKHKRKPWKEDRTPQSDCNVSSSSWGPWSGLISSSTTSCSTSSSRTEGLLASSQRNNQWYDENLNKDQGKEQQRCRGFTFGLCTILVTLLVLILWGKTCSVLCTCMWFFLVPRGNMKCSVSKDKKRFELSEEVLSSEAYRKRVVMEGLLRRERCMYTHQLAR